MSKRRPTSTCVLCGAETPQDMRFCTSCAGKLLSVPDDDQQRISETRTTYYRKRTRR